MNKHRLYPLPEWFNKTSWGTCRWCNKPILDDNGVINTKRRWHKDCSNQYLLVTKSSFAKRQVKKRDKGVCVCCKKKCRLRSEWDVDHIVALSDRPDNNPKWWSLENMATKCVECHNKKTVEENANRRKNRTKD